MKDCLASVSFLAVRLRAAAAAGLIGAAALSGCASDATNGITDQTAGPVDTGTFPNLNIPPKTAAAPIEPDEKNSLFGRLGAAKNAQQAAAGASSPPSNPALLKKIGQTHGDDTLKEIEGQ